MNYLNEFKHYLISQKQQPSKITVKNYLSDVGHFLHWFNNNFQNNFTPTLITPEIISLYKLRGLGLLSSNSIERHFSSLRKFFNFLKTTDQLTTSPFENNNKDYAEGKLDLWHIKEFEKSLYVANAAHLTIKNYINDIRQFTIWLQLSEVATLTNVKSLEDINLLTINSFTQKLLSENRFSAKSINRKLSSLRKYVTWASHNKLLARNIDPIHNITTTSTYQAYLPNQENKEPIESEVASKIEYSSFPPIRLFQKVQTLTGITIDKLLLIPLIQTFDKISGIFMNRNNESFFENSRQKEFSTPTYSNQFLGIVNRSKAQSASDEAMNSNLPMHEKLLYRLKNNRPKWYKKYHSYAFIHYFHFALLLFFTVGIALVFYKAFELKMPNQNSVLSVTTSAVPHTLSYQGLLADMQGQPQTSATKIRFAIYNSPIASKSAYIWQENNNVNPDNNGLFQINLGNNKPLPPEIFNQNSSYWLGISIEGTQELTPRQPLALVANAGNALTLNGMYPITDLSSGGTKANTVLVLDANGNLSIGGSTNPIFEATDGSFTLSGKLLLLTTANGSNSNIKLMPDGLGQIDINKPIQNSSNNNNSSSLGSVEINDTFSVLATSSSQPTFLIEQKGNGDLINALNNGSSKFRVDSNGNINSANWSGSVISPLYGGTGQNQYETGDILFALDSKTISKLKIGLSSECLFGGTTPNWKNCANGVNNLSSSDHSLTLNQTRGDVIISLNLGNANTWSALQKLNGGLISEGAVTGKALAIFNETGDQNIIVASASGTPVMSLDRSGNLILAGTLTESGNPDLAENIQIEDATISAGDILIAESFDASNPNAYNLAIATKSARAYQNNIIGAVSDNPGILLNSKQISSNQKSSISQRPLAIAGRILVKVSTLNGAIKTGDFITSSQIPGVGMKASMEGRVLGVALQDYNQTDPNIVDKILVLINPSWQNPQIQLTSTGDINLADNSPSNTPLTLPHYYSLNDALGNPIEKIGVFSKIITANLEVGFINAKQISVNALSLSSDNLNIAGKTLKQYVTQIIKENFDNNLISPLASIDEVHTNIISPLAKNPSIALKLDRDKLSILNGPSSSSSAVSSFDNQGNATFSGLLTSGNASISGALRAGKIIANEIEGLATNSASYITNIYNNFATSSAFPTLTANLLDNNYAGDYLNIATISGQFTNIPNLNTQINKVNQGLIVNGISSLSDTSVNGQLSINGNFILTNNSVNVIGNDLNLQPLRQGGLSIMAGLIYIDTNGNATFSNNVTINGTLSTNTISPLGDRNLIVNLNSDKTNKSSFIIHNSTNSAVLSINSIGDLIASGAGTFSKLNIDLAPPALAISSSEIIATGSAGTASISAFKTAITVNNVLVTNKSLIYITPVSETNNQVLYLQRQAPGKSFTVGIQNPEKINIPFNWIIIN